MKKWMLLPLIAAVATFATPFASAAHAEERPEQAAVVCFSHDHEGACCVDNYDRHICLMKNRADQVCEHEGSQA